MKLVRAAVIGAAVTAIVVGFGAGQASAAETPSVAADVHGPVKLEGKIIDLVSEAFVTILNKQAEKLVGDLLKDVVAAE